MKYTACCSFGKDSLATIILAHEHNEPLDEIVFVEVMFDENTSGENPEHIKWIRETAIPKLESWGYKVKILHSEWNYVKCFERVKTRSKHVERNGKIQGFPLSKRCFINSLCKVKPMKERDTIQYVGIAIDEPKRLERLKEKKNTISLLEKYNYTEKMAYELCEKHGLLSPIYKHLTRGGCWFCPNASLKELCFLKEKHPDIWLKLKTLYEINKNRMIRHNFSWKITFDELDERLEYEVNNTLFNL